SHSATPLERDNAPPPSTVSSLNSTAVITPGLLQHPASLHHLCSWLDAVVHLHVHELWHLAPVCFDPDPERRDLALLGVGQRHLPLPHARPPLLQPTPERLPLRTGTRFRRPLPNRPGPPQNHPR